MMDSLPSLVVNLLVHRNRVDLVKPVELVPAVELKLAPLPCGDLGGADLFPLQIYKERANALMDWTPQATKKSRPTHTLSVENFVDAVRDGKAPLNTGSDGLMIARIVDALYQSAESRELIVLE